MEYWTEQVDLIRLQGEKQILLPCNVVYSPFLASYVEGAKSAGVELWFLLNSQQSETEFQAIAEIVQINGAGVLFLIDEHPVNLRKKIEFVVNNFPKRETTILLRKSVSLQSLLQQVPEKNLVDLRVYALPCKNAWDDFFTQAELYFLRRDLEQNFPRFKWKESWLVEVVPTGEPYSYPILAKLFLMAHSSWLFWPTRMALYVFGAIVWLLMDPERFRKKFLWFIYAIFTRAVGAAHFLLVMLRVFLERALRGVIWCTLGMLYGYGVRGVYLFLSGIHLCIRGLHALNRARITLFWNYMWTILYPLRKIYYFSEYQWQTRFSLRR